MTDLVELAKRRGFFFQSSEAYGGVSGFYTYGPQGASLKEHVEETWRERFAVAEGHMQIDAPTVMPEPVFEASGHLDGFDDMLVECASCNESHRADHLIEGATDIEEAESLPTDEVAALLDAHDIDCPTCGAPLAGQPVDEFNLMFETNIGPGTSQTGYLRPETAQGIFVEFPRLKEYARGQLPFGVTQVGKSYRNEISPRNALVRTREFTQAELELFVDPDDEGPDVSAVADVEVTLYPAENQPDGDYVETTVGDAVTEGIVDPWVAYYLGVATEWYETIGVDFERFRYRQHQPGERAHYASDCWDAEADVSAAGEEPDWIEIAGYAYRGDYDLTKHDEHADDTFTVFKQYDEPKTVERASVDPDMSYLGPEFGGAAADVADALATLAERDRAAFEDEEVTVTVDGEEYTVPTEKTGFEFAEETEAGRHVTPHVVEPSIGIDRTVYTVLAHAYDEDEVDEGERTVLRLDTSVAPTGVAVFPLMDKDGMGERARDIAADLRAAGYDVTYDDSGNIGRRYRRQDEIGTPFCVTVDYESVEDDPETVTLRERDSTEQVRVASDDLESILADLRAGETTFDDL
ncbi:glycine--tRNA ligase [Halarchaeum salinum]|uniref:glycine--tRNA ligase n=1 Tax=Halarchaeum salinum TaxID=489912 RepID=A0AAV3S4S0_9EURY